MRDREELTLADFMTQMEQVKKLGGVSRVMESIPGMRRLAEQVHMGDEEVEGQMARMRGIYDAMTTRERGDIGLLEASRRRRVARGAGVDVLEVSQFVRQFEISREMMAAVGGVGWARQATGLTRAVVLGLVTGDPVNRDPSELGFVGPVRWWGRSLGWLALAAAGGLMASYVWRW